jgi:hypothetical protein
VNTIVLIAIAIIGMRSAAMLPPFAYSTAIGIGGPDNDRHH